MPNNEREVFDYLTSDNSTSTEIDFLTYAIFANERKEWVELFKQKNGSEPTQDQIDEWISNITDWRFLQMRNEAAGFFDTAARAYLSDDIEAAKTEALHSAILTEVRQAGTFWRQFGMALATAILAPLILGGIIALTLLYDQVIPTATDFSKRFQQGTSTPQASPQ